MLFKNPLLPLFLLLQLLPSALSHTPSLPPATSGDAPPFPTIIPGSDAPADYATTGYVLNHFSLNVNNITASLDFYAKVFGMRLIFTFRATEKVSISYLAHSHGGKNGTAYQTTSELNRNKNNMEGLLELLHYDYDNYKHPTTASVDNTFSHFGIIVPCINSFQKRLDKFKIPIVKRAGGEVTEEALEVVAKSYGLRKLWDEDQKEAASLLRMLLESIPGFSDFVFMTDPDGNLIEVQPQELPQLPL